MLVPLKSNVQDYDGQSLWLRPSAVMAVSEEPGGGSCMVYLASGEAFHVGVSLATFLDAMEEFKEVPA